MVTRRSKQAWKVYSRRYKPGIITSTRQLSTSAQSMKKISLKKGRLRRNEKSSTKQDPTSENTRAGSCTTPSSLAFMNYGSYCQSKDWELEQLQSRYSLVLQDEECTSKTYFSDLGILFKSLVMIMDLPPTFVHSGRF